MEKKWYFTEAEIELIRTHRLQNIPAKITSQMINRPARSIRALAHRMQIPRKIQKLEKTVPCRISWQVYQKLQQEALTADTTLTGMMRRILEQRYLDP